MSIWRIASPPPGPGPPSQSLDLAPAGLRKSTLQGLHVFNKGSNHVSVVRRQGKHWSVPHGSRLRPPLRANYAVVSRRQNPRSREASVQPSTNLATRHAKPSLSTRSPSLAHSPISWTATTTLRGVDLDVEKPVIPPALGVQVDRREGKKKSSRESSTFNEQKGHRQNQIATPSVIRSPPAPIVFWLWLRLGGKRSSLKGWAGDDQGPIQLPGAPCSQHRPPYPANGCSAPPIQEGNPANLQLASGLQVKPFSYSTYGVVVLVTNTCLIRSFPSSHTPPFFSSCPPLSGFLFSV
ncbi:hypothetical protein TgHK011_006232 [Trichoderma gracile]|nr:hypothetical protein TgHK011_006232 [Trichoderma gracile]